MSDLFKVVEAADECSKVSTVTLSYDKGLMVSILGSIYGADDLSTDRMNEHLVDLLTRSVYLNLNADHSYLSRRDSDDF